MCSSDPVTRSVTDKLKYEATNGNIARESSEGADFKICDVERA